MAIKAVRMYAAEDGKVFPSMDEANKYNAQQKALRKIKMALNNSSNSFSLGTLHIDLLNNPTHLTEMRDACNKALEYHRNYGKLKK